MKNHSVHSCVRSDFLLSKVNPPAMQGDQKVILMRRKRKPPVIEW